MTRGAMLIPKPTRRRRFIPALLDCALNHVVGDLAPRECKALSQICETADLLTVDEEPWLLVPADPRLPDRLAVFGAEAEDREMDLEDEPQADDGPSLGGLEYINQTAWAHGGYSDDELDECDMEPDDPEARERFTRARQVPGFTINGITNSRYDSTKDWDELRRVERAVARLPNRR